MTCIHKREWTAYRPAFTERSALSSTRARHLALSCDLASHPFTVYQYYKRGSATPPIVPCTCITQDTFRNRNGRARQPSPTSACETSANKPYIPPALTRDHRRRNAWIKARAQYARDRDANQSTVAPACNLIEFGPSRERSAFVKEEELRSLMEARVGTLHTSELLIDDEVCTQMSVEELGAVSDIVSHQGDQGRNES